MAKQLFNGLVKYSGTEISKYNTAKSLGKLVFAEITGTDPSAGKYIYANGIEYKIADATDFDKLTARVDAFAIEAKNDKLILTGLDANKNTSTYAEIPLADSTYVKLETDDGSIQASLDENQMVFAEDDDESKKIATDGWVYEQLDEITEVIDEHLDNLDASVNDLSTRMNDVETSANTYYDNALQTVIVRDDSYINASFGEKTGNAGDKSQTLTIGIDPSALTKATDSKYSNDVSIATKGYVDEQVAKAIAGGVVYRGTVATLPEEGMQNGDMYKMSETDPETGEGHPEWKKGDVAIWLQPDPTQDGDWEIIPAGDDIEYTGVKVGDTLVIDPTKGGDVTFVAETGDDALIEVAGNGGNTPTVTYTATDKLKSAVATVEGLDIATSTSTGNYIDIESSYNASTFDISLGVKIVKLEDIIDEDTNTGLADARDVKEALDEISS